MKHRIIVGLIMGALLNFCSNAEDFIFPTHEQWADLLTEKLAQSIMRDCDFAIQQINQFDLTPFTITQPGLYCLGSDLQISSTQSAAIIINSDNVIVDLNDKIIQGAGLVNGIRVLGRSSVIIRNGKIATMGLNGILIGSSLINNFNPRNIIVSDIVFLNNATALNLNNVQNGAIIRCAAINSTVNAFVSNQCTNAQFHYCVANNNIRGFLLTNNLSLVVNGCTANSNTTEGFSQLSGIAYQYQNCIANQNNIGFNVVNTSAVAQSISSIFTNCSASINRNIGFNIAGSQHTLQDCFSHTNISHGFQVNGTNQTILQCEAKDNGGTGFALIAATTTSVTATACHIRDNVALGNSIGFSNVGTTNRIYGNYANNNFTGTVLNNYVGITNVAISPSATTPINHTANISE